VDTPLFVHIYMGNPWRGSGGWAPRRITRDPPRWGSQIRDGSAGWSESIL